MLICLSVILVLFVSIKLYLSNKKKQYKTRQNIVQDRKIVAFFHPFCNAGGGGERVLWAAIKGLNQQYPDHHYIIYSDRYNVDSSEILSKAKRTFQIDYNFSVQFIQLDYCFLLSPKYYPMFTLVGQNLGSMFVGLEALFKCPPDILIDTLGASFIFPLFKFLGSSKIYAYVHYPIISVDMLNVVAANVASFNNQEFIARSVLLTKAKLIYYKIFSFFYKLSGKCADIITVNSSWTKDHIDQVWNTTVSITYPPCNTQMLKKLSLQNKDNTKIISISQFRPEKNHQQQIESLAKLIDLLKENGSEKRPTLVLVGSCRNDQDEKRVQELRRLCTDLHVEENVQFKVNIEYLEMQQLIESSSIAIHTMKNEHFGISVVEFLAAGLLTLVHNSGGPKLDIIQENVTGFLANDSDQFADSLYKLIHLSEEDAMKFRIKARESVDRFSDETFEKLFVENIKTLYNI